MFVAHNYAISLESIVIAAIGGIKRGDLGGIVNSDNIEHKPFIAICLALASFYVKTDKKDDIDNFLASIHDIQDISIQEIGEDRIKEIINEINRLTKN
ncbi:hypothetical protein FACS1894105_13910 [Clostridia bacterium]|nr:hypothetical protein FACS1894105_13910 [Clostridia bacterium]GHV15134.1 hypothetical protein FACS1894219_11860 [Clostridia bacterium]